MHHAEEYKVDTTCVIIIFISPDVKVVFVRGRETNLEERNDLTELGSKAIFMGGI